MNSKFFSTENQYISDDESDTNSVQSKDENKKLPNLRFDDDSSSEDTRRVVRREKDKRYESMKLVISHINAKIKIEDFVLMLVEFDEPNKLLEKSKRVIEKEGIPRFYIRICSQLETFLANLPTETKNSLKPANKRAYNTLKHKVRKNNKLYENYIKTFLEDPVDSDTSEEPEFEEESSIDEQREEDDRALRRRYLRSSDPMVRRNYWLKREPKVPIVSKPTRPNPVVNVEETNIHIDKNEPVVRNETTPKETQRKRYALDNMEKTIEHILERRVGKGVWAKDKNITLEEELNILQNYYEQASGMDLNRLEILFVLLPIRMDFSRQYSHYYMPRNLWLENFKNLEEIFKIISNKKNVLGQVRTFNRDGEHFYKEKATLDLFCAHFEELENELSKAFRETESSSMDYIERLSDNALLIKLAYEGYLFFDGSEDNVHAIKFAQKYFEFTYYMPDKLFEKLRVSAKDRGISSKSEFYEKPVTETIMKELTTKVYSSADNQMIVKTVLQHIYNHAINGRYETAKEMFQMSHIAKISSNLDSGTQILYNRTLVQLGVCAFSHGSIRDCIDALDEIAGSGRLRELIGQGVSRNNVKGDETRNLLPSHMHIDVELVQAVHLIAIMLVEIPNTLVTDCYDVNKRPVSRVFKRQYEAYKNFHGLPETDRDYIMIAGKELATGDWRSCYQLLLSTKIWAKLTQNVKLAKENLLTQMKQQALKCEFLNCQNYYESLEILTLGGKFELNIESLQSIINHLIFNMEIQAYVDIQSNCIVFENRRLAKLESRALGLTEKVCNLVENNEKIMNSKYGSSVLDKDMTETTVRKYGLFMIEKADYNRRKGPTKKFNAIIGKEDRKIRAIKTLKI